MANLTEDDIGKSVVDADGVSVGTISSVEEGTAYVEPDRDTYEKVKSKLDWGDEQRDAYPINSREIAKVSDEEVRIG